MNKLLSFNPEPFASEPLHELPHQEFDAELETEFGSRRPRGRMPYAPNKNLRMQPRGMRKTPMPRPRPASFPPRLPHGYFPSFPIIAPSWPILTDPERPLEPTEPGNAGYPGGEPSMDNRPSSDSASEHVRWVQNCLNHYLGLRLPTDGLLTAATRSAIRLFQERRGLPANGLIGPETEQALATVCGSASPLSVNSAIPTGELAWDSSANLINPTRFQFGFEGEASWEGETDRNSPDYIRWLQTTLNRLLGLRLAVDGRSGTQTRAAVRSFQQKQGLNADGIVGDQTEGRLIVAGATPPPTGGASIVPTGGTASMRIDSPLPQSGPGFYSYKPQSQQYGLTETIRALQTIGAAWAKAHPQDPSIGFGDISKRGGGPMSGHKSHQLGLDVDIRLMRKDGRKEATTYQSSTYSRPLTQELINLIRANGVLKVQYIFFNDPQASGVSKWPNHDNHLHVRFYAPQSKGSQSPTPNWDKAIEQNRHYATSLGWQGQFDKIVALLGFSNMTPNERLFAEALARWQASQGLKADGVLGPKTWGRMRPALTTPGIPAPVSGGLAFGAKVSAEFRNRVRQISADIGIDPNFLMAAMAFETGETFSPSIRNKTSGATGLIQFMPKTATNMGTSTDALATMTAERQLDYVARYFSPFRGKLRNLEDVYMAILWPKAVGSPNDTVLFAEPSMAYQQNKALDRNGDGKVTKAEAAAPVAAKLVRGRQTGFVG